MWDRNSMLLYLTVAGQPPAQANDLVWRVIFATTIIPGIVAVIIRLF